MPLIQCMGQSMHTYGELPSINQAAPDFNLTDIHLGPKVLSKDYSNLAVLINVYPSLDTKVCFDSVATFQQALKDTPLVVLGVSMDTPFALKRISKKLSSENIELLSDMRNRHFGGNYGVTIADGPLGGFLARAVFLLNSEHLLIHRELVTDVAQPPNYEVIIEKALSSTL